MPDIPTRLLVISARVPEGGTCIPAGAKMGCQFLGVSSTHYIPRCHLYNEDMCDLDRLSACRERDGWVVFPPGSGVPELVEAAKEMHHAIRHSEDVGADGTLDAKLEANARHSKAEAAYYEAARKVAKGSNDVPRD